jgi:hypothetical protein
MARSCSPRATDRRSSGPCRAKNRSRSTWERGAPTTATRYSTGQRRSFFGDGDRVLLPHEGGDLIVWDLATASTSVRLRAVGPVFVSATVALDGEHIEHHERNDYLATYAASRRGLIAAACRALAGTDAWEAVAKECGSVSP